MNTLYYVVFDNSVRKGEFRGVAFHRMTGEGTEVRSYKASRITPASIRRLYAMCDLMDYQQTIKGATLFTRKAVQS